jgi:DNA polymerase V
MEEAVAAYTARAAGKMRRQNLTTASLQVFVHTNRFRMEDAQHFATQSVQLPIATADTGKLTSAALRGLAAIWKQGYRYKTAGVIFLVINSKSAEGQHWITRPAPDLRSSPVRSWL